MDVSQIQAFVSAGATIFAATVAAIVTITLGIGQLQIAKAQRRIADEQRRIAHERLRLDLFDRRFAIYQSLRRAGVFTQRSNKERAKVVNELIGAVANGRFLFPDELNKYFEELTDKVVRLYILDRKLESLSPDEALDETEMAEIQPLIKHILEEVKKGPELLKPFLSFGHIVRDHSHG